MLADAEIKALPAWVDLQMFLEDLLDLIAEKHAGKKNAYEGLTYRPWFGEVIGGSMHVHVACFVIAAIFAGGHHGDACC
jgi:hypothetical protein